MVVKVGSYKRKVGKRTVYNIWKQPVSAKQKYKWYQEEFAKARKERPPDWRKIKYLARGLQMAYATYQVERVRKGKL